MYRISALFLVFSFLQFSFSHAQQKAPVKIFSHADSLRGSDNPERAWWDVLRYDISLVPDFEKKFIRGVNLIRFRVLHPGRYMQIDLQEPMQVQNAFRRGQPIGFKRLGNAYILEFPETLSKGETDTLEIHFEGHPREAVKPPWDGGWIWTHDQLGRPWMTVTCQGIGASVWYPCKEYQGDEPDSGASLSVTVADTLVAVANGKLLDKKNHPDGTATYSWSVVNPINNYCLVPYIGKYLDIQDHFAGEKGVLPVDYWVLDYNREKAIGHMQPEVQRMLRCFEYWMGPYPFYEDGYKIVDAPYLGMENQSAIAYGNGYQNGYLGRDQSGTGWGNKWDFIIVHESGHEWFANSITTGDLADWWVHEGFTTYSETLFTTYYYGKTAGDAYNFGLRKHILNDEPIIGPYGVNYDGTQDAYYKASSMIHNIRQIMDNDDLFRHMLRELNRRFYHQTVTTDQIEKAISQLAKKDFSKIFDQYLRTTRIPVLEYKIEGSRLSYRWANCVKGFDMPVKIRFGKERWLSPGEEWKSASWHLENAAVFSVDPNFYINLKKLD